MKKEIKVWAMTMIACWFWAPIQTLAQQDSLPATTLREVVVTATKFPKSVAETGKVLIIIDEEQLRRSEGKDLSQLLNEQAGLVVNGANSNPGKDKAIYLRGALGQYTLILIDGIPVNDPSGVGGAYDPRLLPIDQIERIEILKGSQSTLYGTDAMAGVINIITKKKGDKPFSASGTLAYGSFNTLKGNAGFSGTLKKLDYHVSYSRLQTAGISEAIDTTGAAGFDRDGYTQDAMQVSLGYHISDRISIQPFMRFADFNGGYDAGPFADDPTANYRSELQNYGANAQWKGEQSAITLMYASTASDRLFTDAWGSFQYDGRFQHAEVFLRHRLLDLLTIMGGINYQHFRMIEANTSMENSSASIISPYLSVLLASWRGLSAEVGGRLNNHTVYGNNSTFSINPSYVFLSHWKLYANYSTGFKAPTLTQLFGRFGANESLQPERSSTLEGGVQFILADKRFDTRITVFNRIIDDAIVYTDRFVNLNTLNDWGIEVESAGRWKNITFTGFYAFVEGEFTTPTVQGPETKPGPLFRRPKHSFGFTVGYPITERFFASSNFKTFGARNDAFFDLTTFESRTVRLSPYQLLDVYVEYTVPGARVKVFGDLRNILNQDYMEVYGYTIQRFNALVGLRFHW